MAIQNAVHRVHLASAPPSTLMTGTTTQIMLDLADKIYTRRDDEKRAPSKLVPMSVNILAFALGCALAALAY
ncbi:DUF1275 family protein, partial [Escherichia coli]|uniref:DUF1275 family protein n=1 Tax=Escherichia coli TaxID=562 RepID=UPI0019530932